MAPPGDPGNFAVAGHRTSHGAPFGRLDELTPGDLVHLTDHAGQRWTYAVAERRIVDPVRRGFSPQTPCVPAPAR